MSTQQPEALRLAEILELGSRQFNKEAAAELRRLHALNAELLADMKAARQSMQFAYDTPNGPISDTIWHGPSEPLFGFMD